MSGVEERTQRRQEIEVLRLATAKLLGSERRLRSRDHSRPGELTHAQLRALATLGREQAMTAGALARAADLNPASVTAILDQLEAANVVQRQRSTEDRRLCNVCLTQEGRDLLERKLAHWHSLWDERLADFSDRDLETAARVINAIGEIYELLSGRLDAAAADARG
jgi:DNA-binding MarR family transcriptional regulator